MKQNILLVENSGADFYKSRLKFAHSLLDDGWQVNVLVPNDGFSDLISDEGIRVFNYDLARNRNWFNQIIKILAVYRKIFKEVPVDLVHSFRFFPNMLNILANIFSKRKVVLHITGLGIAYSNREIKFVIYRVISNIIYFFMIWSADAVIVQNQDDLNELGFFPFLWRKLQLIKGSGVDTDYYNSENTHRLESRNKLKVSADELVFICVTRLIWEKGIVELVNAFRSVSATTNKAKLLIVGSPDISNPRHVSLAYIEEATHRSNISFLGNRDDIRELLAASDVFIYPSYYREGIPRSVLEAIAMGLPVITTDTPGCNLTVTDGINGLLIAPRSENAIVEAVMAIIKSPERLVPMGINSRHAALELFSDRIIYKEIKMVYNKCL